MRSTGEIRDFLNLALSRELDDLDEELRRSRRRSEAALPVGFALGMFLTLAVGTWGLSSPYPTGDILFFTGLFFVCAAIIMPLLVEVIIVDRAGSAFSEAILHPLFGFMVKDLVFRQGDPSFSATDLDQSAIFPFVTRRLDFENDFHGQMAGRAFDLAQIRVHRRVDNKPGGSSHLAQFFTGLFLRAPLKAPIGGSVQFITRPAATASVTDVLFAPDPQGRVRAAFARHDSRTPTPWRMMSPVQTMGEYTTTHAEFNRHFRVFASDVETFERIVTQELIEALLGVREEMLGTVEEEIARMVRQGSSLRRCFDGEQLELTHLCIGLEEGHLYVARPYTRRLFRSSPLDAATAMEQAERAATDLRSILRVQEAVLTAMNEI